MSYPVLNQNKAFKYQSENMGLLFDKKNMITIKTVLKKDNSRVLALMMFMII